jgi:hypothetical protein
MKTFNIILSALKQMENNKERKDFLNSIVSDQKIHRDDLRKITCKIFIESNFVDSYFKPSFKEIIKINFKHFLKKLK